MFALLTENVVATIFIIINDFLSEWTMFEYLLDCTHISTVENKRRKYFS